MVFVRRIHTAERGQEKPQAPHGAGPGSGKSHHEQDPLQRILQLTHLPLKTIEKANAAEHFFSDKLLLFGKFTHASAWLPTPAPAGKQLPTGAFKSPLAAGAQDWGCVSRHTLLQRPSTQTFPPSRSCSCAVAQPEQPPDPPAPRQENTAGLCRPANTET